MIYLLPVRRLAVVGTVVAGLIVGVACGGDEEPLGPTATVPRATTTTNPYAIPTVIDEAYVNRVLAGLDQGLGDVTRLLVRTKTVPTEAIERLKAFYAGRALQLQVDSFQRDELEQFVAYREDPDNQITTVTELIDAAPVCIFAQVNIDVSPVSLQPDPAFAKQWVILARLDPAKDPLSYNPTGWIVLYQGFNPDLTAPPNLCAAF